MWSNKSITKVFLSLSEAARIFLKDGAVDVQTKAIYFAFSCRNNTTSNFASWPGISILFIFISLTSACAPIATPSPEPQVIDVYSTPATRLWLADVFTCAPTTTIIRVVNSPADADISLRLGEPEMLVTPAFQIDTDDILVITHGQSIVQNMALDEVRSLFAGRGDPSVQVWVHASGEDVQKVFDQEVMQGRSITSTARLATSPELMANSMVSMPNTVGILTRRWMPEDVRVVYTIPDVPVLAILGDEPQGAIRDVIFCLQK